MGMSVSERIRTIITRQKEGVNMAQQERESYVLKAGDTVRNKATGELGTVAHSTFGVKVTGINADGSRWKTNGYAPKFIARYWEVDGDE